MFILKKPNFNKPETLKPVRRLSSVVNIDLNQEYDSKSGAPLIYATLKHLSILPFVVLSRQIGTELSPMINTFSDNYP